MKKIASEKAISFDIINQILGNELAFSDQITYTEPEFNIKELSPEKKGAIVLLGKELIDIAYSVENIFSEKGDIYNFLMIIFEGNPFISNDLMNYPKNIIKKLSAKVNEPRNRGGSYGTSKVLKSDGSIELINSVFKISTMNSDDFISKLKDIKLEYLSYVEFIKSFSIDMLLRPMGYSSLDEFLLYYKKFIEISKGEHYIDFFHRHDGEQILKEIQDFDIAKYIVEKFSFFISKNQLWVIENKENKKYRIFSRLSKSQLDNFNEFINSFAVVFQNNLSGVTDFYANLEDENSLSNEVRKIFEKGNLVQKYYNNNLTFSFENGAGWVCYDFVINHIIKPCYEESFGKYSNQANAYNLEFLKNMTFENFKSIISKNDFAFDHDRNKVLNTLNKKTIIIPPSFKEIAYESLMKKIMERNKEPIDLDEITMEIDSGYKNKKYDLDLYELFGFDGHSINKLKLRFIDQLDGWISSNILDDMTKKIVNRLGEFENSEDAKSKLSDEEIIKISLSKKYTYLGGEKRSAYSERKGDGSIDSSGYSYKRTIAILNSKIDDLKNKLKNKEDFDKDPGILYPLENIDPNLFDGFFDGLKKVLIKQIQQEEACFQGKSLSMGILYDLTLNNVPLKETEVDNNIINYDIYNFPEKSIFNLFDSFSEQLLNNFHSIYQYFSIFPSEAIQFFSLTDFNQIKIAIIRMINFLNNADNYNKIGSIHNLLPRLSLANINGEIKVIRDFGDFFSARELELKTLRRNMEGKENTEDIDRELRDLRKNRFKIMEDSISATEFMVRLFENKNAGTKKEKIEKIHLVSKIIHNFSNSDIYLNIVLNSKYISRAYNKTISDILMEIGSVINSSINIKEKMEYIMEKHPQYIPKEYLTENILFCVNNINKINNSDDLDIVIDKLSYGNISENMRRFKYLISISMQYEVTSRWISIAKEKVEDVFSPNFSTDKFRFRVLGNFDPYHFRVGADTDCCQAIGGVGENAAIDSFINPNAGVLLLEVKDYDMWKLAAQSYFHYAEIYEENTMKKAILLDNIEAGALKDSYEGNDFYRKAYATLAKLLKQKGFDIVGCGKQYTEVISSDDFGTTSLPEDPRHFEIEEYNEDRYEDFDSDDFLNLLEPNFSFDMPEVKSLDSEMSNKSAKILKMYFNKIGHNKATSLYKLSSILNLYSLKKEALGINYLIPELIW